jgi:hypothetical protein
VACSAHERPFEVVLVGMHVGNLTGQVSTKIYRQIRMPKHAPANYKVHVRSIVYLKKPPLQLELGHISCETSATRRTLGHTIVGPRMPSPQDSTGKRSEKASHCCLSPAVSTRHTCHFVGPSYDRGPNGLSGGDEGIRFWISILVGPPIGPLAVRGGSRTSRNQGHKRKTLASVEAQIMK